MFTGVAKTSPVPGAASNRASVQACWSPPGTGQSQALKMPELNDIENVCGCAV